MDICPVTTLDQAKALGECFHDTYGLTYHNRYVYEPARLLDMIASGELFSLVAHERGQVRAHLGMFVPFFDVRDADGPLYDPAIREVGLSLVHPAARKQHLQSALSTAMVQRAQAEGIDGAFMKCVTTHTASQREAYATGGSAVALCLGGVPRWTSYEQAPAPDPISTMVFFAPLRRHAAAPIGLGEGRDWLRHHIDNTPIRRVETTPGPPPEQPTLMHTTWRGDRRTAFIHVTRPGPDLVERLAEQTDWLTRGHIAHVSVLLPAFDPVVATHARALREIGLFLGGWIPRLRQDGQDVLLYQALTKDRLNTTLIQAHGPNAVRLKSDVIAEWQQSRTGHRQAA